MKTYPSTTPSWQLLRAFSYRLCRSGNQGSRDQCQRQKPQNWPLESIHCDKLPSCRFDFGNAAMSRLAHQSAGALRYARSLLYNLPWLFHFGCVEGPLGTAFRVPVYLLLRRAV